MRIDLERSSFVVPPGFRDITNYSFKSEAGQPQELLTVMYEPVPPDVNGLDALMESRRQRLDVAGDDLGMGKPEAAKPTTLAGLEARQTSYVLDDGEEKYREWMVVALISPSQYVQVTYMASASDRRAQSRFEHIRQSAILAGRPRPGAATASAGFTRRAAGQMTLDVPASLRPPPVYLFTSTDEKISLTINENTAASSPSAAPEDNLRAQTADGSKLGELRSSDIAVGGGRGRLTSSTLTSPAGRRTAVWQGVLFFDQKWIVQFSGEGPLEQAKEVEAAVAALQRSISGRGG
jgi:hypothetical protein